jgi:glycosyltransferase involved in cell wall biosynthesis
VAAPYFSILLPTKNRSEIVGAAIQSVLDQSDPDFELVVSDNDDSPEATRDAVRKFSDDRIRYFRTSGALAMHENWDNAFDHSTGRHVLILEDKMRLDPHALRHLRIAHEAGAQAVSYPILFVPIDQWRGGDSPSTVQRYKSRKVMERFARFDARAFDTFPKGLDCCTRRELLMDIKRKSPTGFLFSYICPDYAFGFLLLSHIETFHRLDRPLAYIPNNWGWSGNYSNGQASYRKNDMIRRFLASQPVSADDITSRVPVKSEFLWINLVLYDLFTKYRRSDHPLVIHWPAYHAFVLTLILIGRRLEADMTLEWNELKRSLWSQSPIFWLQFLIQFLLQSVTNIRRAMVARFQKS